MADVKETNKGIRGRVLEMNIVETWGDHFYVGLTGLEVLDEKDQVIPIKL